ncbi:hypothetical protein FHX71_005200 [Promicromonospora sukumoe]|uniref:Uncharacterized protein n=1 Tax=Promicromonospora sukumoe TaxID=88382 RepID=A0A7W3JE61_9MICO|nr:hypothetical protein [Promicromonospora sukumoe]
MTLCAPNAPMYRLMPMFARGVTMDHPRTAKSDPARGDTPG